MQPFANHPPHNAVDWRNNMDTEKTCDCRHKATPRDEATLHSLQNRLKRIMGQLGGIQKMLEENRYCGDILIQTAAVERAIQGFSYQVLQEHLETCVAGELAKGNTEIVAEAVELIKKLK